MKRLQALIFALKCLIGNRGNERWETDKATRASCCCDGKMVTMMFKFYIHDAFMEPAVKSSLIVFILLKLVQRFRPVNNYRAVHFFIRTALIHSDLFFLNSMKEKGSFCAIKLQLP